RPILLLYLIGTFSAALVAVVASFLWRSVIHLKDVGEALSPPGAVVAVLRTLVMSAVDNAISVLLDANYIGILLCAVALGVALRSAPGGTKGVLTDLAGAVTWIVQGVIRLAPIGILGLVAAIVAETGLGALAGYVRLLAVLLGCMLFIALVVNPLIVFV